MKIIILLITPFLFFSCAQKPARTDAPTAKTFTIEDEKLLARQTLPEFRKNYPAFNDELVQDYVNGLGLKIVKANGLDKIGYEFSFVVVKSESVNAFAFPAGTIFITLPLLQRVESEAELAGVLGHEIAHVVLRHSALRVFGQNETTRQSYTYGAAGAVAGGAIIGLLALNSCPGGGFCVGEAAVLGATAGSQAGLYLQKQHYMQNNRLAEAEADKLGISYAVKAGYNQMRATDFYVRLAQDSKSKNLGLADIMKTHPPDQKRIEALQDLETKSGTGVTTTSHFLEVQKKVKKINL